MENISIQQPKAPLSGMGYLIVRASTAGGAIPLEGARVTVRNWNEPGTESSAGSVRHILHTDRDGNTERLPLPAPLRSVAYTPGGIPYAFYDIDVVANGFYPQQFVRVPIYDTVTSIQNSYLIPLSEGSIHDGGEPLGDVIEEGVNPML